MKTRKFTREFVDAYVAGDGTVFEVATANPLNPSCEEMAEAERQCKAYENSALYIVMEKLSKSGAVLASNFIPGFEDYKVVDAIGSPNAENNHMKVSVFLPIMIADMIGFDYGSYDYMAFRPTKEEDIDLLKQLVTLSKRWLSSDTRHCGARINDIKLNEIYYVGVGKDLERYSHGSNDIIIISHDKIKEQLKQQLIKLEENIELIEDPSKFVFNYETAKVERKDDKR